MAACRQIPYGIQQPAVSAQVARLEEDLGVRLFDRRPFRLTPAGKALYDFIAPFFGRLSEVEDIVKGKMSRVIRLAGFTEAMREHVPVLPGETARALSRIESDSARDRPAWGGTADCAGRRGPRNHGPRVEAPSRLPHSDVGASSPLPSRESGSAISRRGRFAQRRSCREGATDQSTSARVAVAAVPKRDDSPQPCLENRYGDKFAGFGVHLCAKPTRCGTRSADA